MTNAGVPIIFVVNKSDNPYPKYDDKTEFIFRHIRKNAIKNGATIIYTSTKSNYNIHVLYDYIFHILLNFDLVHKCNLNDKTAFFIPSGYDRLSVLKSNDTNHDLDFEYTDVVKEEQEEVILEDKIECEKVSDFLKKVKERTYRSRKSLMREDLKFGKSGGNEKLKKKDTMEKEAEVIKEVVKQPAEKVNKFQKFMEKKEPKIAEVPKEKDKISKEERTKITRENLLNKLKLGKKDKK